jgi:hypothetical protein
VLALLLGSEHPLLLSLDSLLGNPNTMLDQGRLAILRRNGVGINSIWVVWAKSTKLDKSRTALRKHRAQHSPVPKRTNNIQKKSEVPLHKQTARKDVISAVHLL